MSLGDGACGYGRQMLQMRKAANVLRVLQLTGKTAEK
jgi:hypothetical protein